MPYYVLITLLKNNMASLYFKKIRLIEEKY